MRYKVIIGWRCTFIFDDRDEAMCFAYQAAKHRCTEDDGNEIRIEFLVPERETGEEVSENE